MRTPVRHLLIMLAVAPALIACNRQIGLPETPVTPTAPTTSTPFVASVLITPAAVNAGESVQGTILLTGPAPASGVAVSLSASDDAAMVAPIVTIPGGSSQGDFTVATRPVSNDRQVDITASAANRSATATLSVWADALVFFQWISEAGDFIGAGGFGRLTEATATFRASCGVNGVNIQIRGSGSDFWSASFSGPAGVPLRQGAFEGATRWPFNTATPGLDISGRSRGCNTLSGRFVIHDIDLQNNRCNRFHASFVQRCGTNPGLLTGDIRVIN
jgi:hypothetical protein